MNTQTLLHTIPLYRGAWSVLLERLHHGWLRLHSTWAVHRARSAAESAERELAQLDPRTLQDIGAPQGLVGQRRWQEEQRESRDLDRLLDLRGW